MHAPDGGKRCDLAGKFIGAAGDACRSAQKRRNGVADAPPERRYINRE
ncbi:MAG: hypothetical protein HY755_05605 [Nitrospirae bacterium]|nr:hypothetical protein [Nitrospirota bacterium]